MARGGAEAILHRAPVREGGRREPVHLSAIPSLREDCHTLSSARRARHEFDVLPSFPCLVVHIGSGSSLARSRALSPAVILFALERLQLVKTLELLLRFLFAVL
jgi:hypothetical protein